MKHMITMALMALSFITVVSSLVSHKHWYRSNRRPCNSLFTRPYSSRIVPLHLSENENSKEADDIVPLYFDDFGGQVMGGERGPQLETSQLLTRIQTMQQEQIRKDAQLVQNWRSGNWQVRGFSLESNEAPVGSSEPTNVAAAARICKIVPAADENTIWVGRTDGSVVCVKLGTEYWTQFHNSKQDAAEKIGDAKIIGADDTSSKPFEIKQQFKTATAGSAISCLLAHNSHIFTANKGHGDITRWLIPEDHGPVQSVSLLAGVHSDTVLCLKPVSLRSKNEDDPGVIFSAAVDGSLGLWDIETGELLYQCRTAGSSSTEPFGVCCADSDGTHIYLGTTTGEVLAYSVQDLLKSKNRDVYPTPNGRWFAATEQDVHLTALVCGGDGSLGRGQGQSTSLVLTGDAKGLLKQWEVLSRAPDGGQTRLEQWPKMATQRLPKKAHVFNGHYDEVTAIIPIDSTKFVSASKDGTVRAWNPVNGKELFRMDGFSETLSSLCLLDQMLVTDGMEQFVCVHDFDILPQNESDIDYLDGL
jgi:WD40 repeat protein